jgi:hypothetical protein
MPGKGPQHPRPRRRGPEPKLSLRVPQRAAAKRQVGRIIDEDEASLLDLIDNLFDRLPAGGHELVLFDINRVAQMEPIFAGQEAAMLEKISVFVIAFLALATFAMRSPCGLRRYVLTRRVTVTLQQRRVTYVISRRQVKPVGRKNPRFPGKLGG